MPKSQKNYFYFYFFQFFFLLTAHYYVGRISSSPCRCCDARVSFSLFFFYIFQCFDCDGFHCPLLLLAFSLSRISFCFNVPTPAIKRESYSFRQGRSSKEINVQNERITCTTKWKEKKKKKKWFSFFFVDREMCCSRASCSLNGGRVKRRQGMRWLLGKKRKETRW